ncbi:major capsid protein [Sigmofec virus UA08Rod_5433]|uniref:Major capsid protein n=1 Tax=Sigmofec virus UA08Rod_5433 TaxID=2929424 RepID=A0A976N133_9VIRU|nr:major capsid protein [Sigmofec virus UA08Rod_5433]
MFYCEVFFVNRNAESHFALLPHVDISRSTFDRSHTLKTSFNAGDLIPFYVDEVLPGDTFDVKTSKVIRMPSLITPIMDNIFLDTYFFFVPNRLCWEHWRELNGENTQSAWIPAVEYEVPQITSPATTGWSIGSIADYFGIPTGIPGLSVNALPFRAYALICNEWFRDENLTDPLVIPTDDAVVAGTNGTNYITDVAKGGAPFVAAKYHDYFTSALPSPQKGPDVTIPVGTTGPSPVYSTLDRVPNASTMNTSSLQMSGASVGNPFVLGVSPGSDSIGNVFASSFSGLTGGSSSSPQNLWAYPTSDSVAVATINQLRQAFQIQKLYEKDARGGTRYIEILKAHFGVTSPDARLQRPEYLGGNRIPINVNQIVQQSQTTDQSPQGNPVGLSLTSDTHADFRKSFVEHGFVIGLMVARYDHTYQQGLERFWSRKDRFDYYWPVFANLGEQAIKNKEIYAQGSAVDDEVFGYQEAWADYRFKPNHVTGEMRSQSPQTLDSWHLADKYDKLPSLSDSWIREDKTPIDRVIAVTSSITHQFFADIYIKCRSTRPMPMYSVPGLVDHH